MTIDSPDPNDAGGRPKAPRSRLWLPFASNGKGAESSKAPADPIASAFTAAALWIKKTTDARFRPSRGLANTILAKLGDEAATSQVVRHVVVVVAHPDDEAIGAGAVLRDFPNVTVVHVTDGAPLDEGYAQRKGYASRDAYAEARRSEVIAALGIIGILPARIRGLGFTDGEAAWHLVELCHQVADLMQELKPDIVLTHPYEGGHSDHDSTAFAVHLAAGLLQRDGHTPPIIMELTSYHNYGGTRRLFDFLPFGKTPVRTVRLSKEERRTKRRMFEHFTSQHALLKTFPVEVERFRQAPRYLFTVPPHKGELDYERQCRKMTGEQWRAEAEKALQMLRSKERFTGGTG